VSRAEERLLTDDRLPVSAFKIKARLLILFDEGNCVAVPKTCGLLFIEIDEFKIADVDVESRKVIFPNVFSDGLKLFILKPS
jgi:hypothetical protein